MPGITIEGLVSMVNEIRDKANNGVSKSDLDAATQRMAADAEAKHKAALDKQAADLTAKQNEALEAAKQEFEARLKKVPTAPISAEAALGELRRDFNQYLAKGDAAMTPMLKAAMDLGDNPDGGYLRMPPDLASRIIAFYTETSPIMQLATTETTNSDRWIIDRETNEASSGWVGETGTRSETNTPKVTEEALNLKELYAYPKLTNRSLEYSKIDVESWLMGKVRRAFQIAVNTACVTGNGVTSPEGFTVPSSVTDRNTVQGHASTIDDLDALKNISIAGLTEPYFGNAVWAMKAATLATIAALKDGMGRYLLEVPGRPGGFSLFNHPVYLFADMAAIASDAYPVAFADFRAGYSIISNPTVKILRDPYAAKGFTSFYVTQLFDGQVVDPYAFRLLKISAS